MDSTADPDASTATANVQVDEFVTGGTVESHVDVRMSLRIIERFSEGLYSSPNKTFEELVSNSYDAGASRVWISLPADLKDPASRIVVVDDGESMDLQGLQDLWQIGESRKRTTESGKRKQIGKFGIGKLATFVLATRLTYLVYRDGVTRAITMDYSRVRGGISDPQEMALDVKVIDSTEALNSLQRALGRPTTPTAQKPSTAAAAAADPVWSVFGDDAPESWTAAVLTNLKPAAGDLQKGRLHWILRTALPLNPAFRQWLDGTEVKASKFDSGLDWTFVVGSDEDTLPKSAQTGEKTEVEREDGSTAPAYRLPVAGLVVGTAMLYKSSLQKGKSEELGRSHGFFVRVRGRLINLDDPTFDVGPELSHGVLTRFHAVIDADDLDDIVAAPRESLQESPALRDLKAYLLAIFNKARTVHTALDTDDPLPLLTSQGRITDPPPALTQGPFRRMLQRAADGDAITLSNLGIAPQNVDVVSGLLSNGDDLIDSIVIEPIGDTRRLVGYDPSSKAAVVNQQHPFIANYLDVSGASEPLRLVALTELLTEAYMLDENIPPDQVQRVMQRRDAFLRGLVERYPRSAFVVASQLRAASNDEKRLEDAVADALKLLGYFVQRIGGSGAPDGIATAKLGWRSAGDGSESYALTYDAKSSGSAAAAAILEEETQAGAPSGGKKAPRIQAGAARTSILRVHRESAQVKYDLEIAPTETLLVAPDFQGFDDPGSLIGETCRNDGITPIRVSDFARLVELFPFRPVSPVTLREMFRSRHPKATAEWVESLRNSEDVQSWSLPLITEILRDYSERRSPVSVSSLNAALFERTKRDYSDTDVTAVVRGLAALAPRSLYFDGTILALNGSPEKLYEELGQAIAPIEDDVATAMRAIIERQQAGVN